MRKLNSLYFIFSYPIIVFAWLLAASIANGAVKSNESKAKMKELYHCVIIDPSLGDKNDPIEKKMYIFDQDPNSNQARYIGKTATLDFDFKDVPMGVWARKPRTEGDIDFTDTKETATKFHGYIADVEIEINCKKKLMKIK